MSLGQRHQVAAFENEAARRLDRDDLRFLRRGIEVPEGSEEIARPIFAEQDDRPSTLYSRACARPWVSR